MEKLFDEILFVQNKKTALHRGELLVPKLVFLAVNLLSIQFPNSLSILVLIAVNAVALALIGSLRALLYSFALWVLTTLSISIAPILAGTYSPLLLKRSLHAYAFSLSLLLFFSTTPPEVLSTKPILRRFAIPYAMFRYSVREVRDMAVALKTKGWDPGLNPVKYLSLIISAVSIAVVRLDAAVESVRARGLD